MGLMDETAAGATAGILAGVAAGASIGLRAVKSGHQIDVKRLGKKDPNGKVWRIVCTCGWQTHPSLRTTRQMLGAATQHAADAANGKLEMPA